MTVNWTRLSEIDHLDSIGTNAVMRTAAEIRRTVGDPGLFDSVILKVARAMVERRISPTRVGEICDAIVVKRKSLKSPGKYFVRSIQAEYRKAGLSWDGPEEEGEA